MKEMHVEKGNSGVWSRIILSAFLLALVWFIDKLLAYGSPIAAGQLSVNQLQDSNTQTFLAQAGMSIIKGSPIPFFVTAALLVWIWWRPMRKQLDKFFVANLCSSEHAVEGRAPRGARGLKRSGYRFLT